jgi:hypothetical protein
VKRAKKNAQKDKKNQKRKERMSCSAGGKLLVCNWPHSVGQNHFVVKMLFNRDSTIQSTSRRFCADYKSENSIPCQPSE